MNLCQVDVALASPPALHTFQVKPPSYVAYPPHLVAYRISHVACRFSSIAKLQGFPTGFLDQAPSVSMFVDQIHRSGPRGASSSLFSRPNKEMAPIACTRFCLLHQTTDQVPYKPSSYLTSTLSPIMSEKLDMHPNDVEMHENSQEKSQDGSQDGIVAFDKEAEKRYGFN